MSSNLFAALRAFFFRHRTVESAACEVLKETSLLPREIRRVAVHPDRFVAEFLVKRMTSKVT